MDKEHKPSKDQQTEDDQALTLDRYCYSDFGVIGRIQIHGTVLHTLELPWRENKPFVSCIPDGVWPVRSSIYHRGNKGAGYPCLEIFVPGRSEIKIHKGNTLAHIQGCILVGMALDANRVGEGLLKIAGGSSGPAHDYLIMNTGAAYESTINIRPVMGAALND